MTLGRRDFIGNTVLATTATLLSTSIPAALASPAKTKDKNKANSTDSLLIQNQAVLKQLNVVHKTASNCSSTGESCHQHCQERLAEGETEFKHCSIAVQQMLVFSQSIAKLASLKSIRISETLTPAIAAAQACKDACQEHEEHWSHGMHLECKECASACSEFIAACKELQKSLSSSAKA